MRKVDRNPGMFIKYGQVGGVLVETLVRTEEDVVRFPKRLPTASGMGNQTNEHLSMFVLKSMCAVLQEAFARTAGGLVVP